MKIKTITDLYLDQLQAMHSTERQLIAALPTMYRAASHPQLKAIFEAHLEETKEHLHRLNRILDDLGEFAGKRPCLATQGLIEQTSILIQSGAAEEVRDAALICAAQKIEHHEIASYGCLSSYANLLSRRPDVRLLDRSLKQERQADEDLTILALSVVNLAAMAA
jgi:ferritin-like metal-binding protein YciE